jgi:predicted nuclease of predicted toxin-antitoxin system
VKRGLLDQGLAPHAAAILRRHGIDAVHVSDIGLERAEDVFILERLGMTNECVSRWITIFMRTSPLPGMDVLP